VILCASKDKNDKNHSDKLTVSTPPPTFGPHAGAQTLEAGESGLCSQLGPEFADSEFCPEQATINEVECSANTGSGSELPRAVIPVEGNVSVTVDCNDICCY
jgi:hypothetical protein